MVAGCATPTAAPTAAPKAAATAAAPAPAAPTSAGPSAAATAKPSAPSTAVPTPGGTSSGELKLGGAPADTKIKRGGKVTAADSLQPTLDPQVSPSNIYPAMNLMYEHLLYTYVNPANNQPEIRGLLMESWERPDPLTFIFKVRKGVKFHDNSDWTAEAAKWNLERLRDHPKTTAKDIYGIMKSIDIVDPMTIKVTLNAPSASFLYIQSNSGARGRGRMVSMEAVKKLGDDAFGDNPAGTGPFMLEKWVKDATITVKRFDKHYEKGVDGQSLPYLDQVELRYIPDSATILTELKSGNLHIASVAHPQIAPVKSDPNLAIIDNNWTPQWYIMGLNGKKGIFGTNQKMREAAGYAIDRVNMAKTMALEYGSPTYDFWPKGGIGWTANSAKRVYDVNKAKQLIAESGWTGSKVVTILAFATGMWPKQAEIYQSMLKAVGFDAQVKTAERLATLTMSRSNEGYDVYLWSGPFFPDPDGQSRILVSTSPANWTNVESIPLDKCMEEGRSQFDPKVRQPIYERCQQIIYDNAFQHLTWHADIFWGHQKYVKGITAEWEQWDLRYAWLDK
jgi:ABC-type transport system substrate-binding protein